MNIVNKLYEQIYARKCMYTRKYFLLNQSVEKVLTIIRLIFHFVNKIFRVKFQLEKAKGEKKC